MPYINTWNSIQIPRTREDVRKDYPTLVQTKDPLLEQLVQFYNALDISERKDVTLVEVPCVALNTDLDGCLYTAGKSVRNGPIGVTSDNLGIDGVRAIDGKYPGVLAGVKEAAKDRNDWSKMLKGVVGVLGEHNVKAEDYHAATKSIVAGLDTRDVNYMLSRLSPREINVFTGTPQVAAQQYIDKITRGLYQPQGMTVRVFGTSPEVDEKGIFTGDVERDKNGVPGLWPSERRGEMARKLSRGVPKVKIGKVDEDALRSMDLWLEGRTPGVVVNVGNTMNDLELLRQPTMSFCVGPEGPAVREHSGQTVFCTDISYIPTAFDAYPLD